ncbi:MAG: hypothetical protein OXH71_01525 [Candidatus Dadabacteria bacterium]|nr:hypothetical protein [Candidatus Dadabacteria bacterium]
MGYRSWKPQASVSARRAKARRDVAKLRKQGIELHPVEIEGRKIARTFWGRAWCDHLEKFSDYSNRLPRGKSYLRNGLVLNMEISEGEIRAIVSGSDLYMVNVSITPLPPRRWDDIKKRCMGQIGSVLELLQGRLSDNVMGVVTHPKTGLFPRPGEIELDCDCPDWSSLCKHLSAVLYGVGTTLDRQPELLFRLRGVNHEDMVGEDIPRPENQGGHRRIKDDVGDVFGVDLDSGEGEDSGEAGDRTPRSALKKKSEKPTEPTRVEPSVFRGEDVVKLRGRLGLNAAQFARLAGVSVGSVRLWESRKGRLDLRGKSVLALEKASSLKKSEARRKLGLA